MGVVFLGTPSAAVPSLAALADVEDIDLVITKPDQPAPRGGGVLSPPVKVAATHFGFDVAQPDTRKDLLATLSQVDAKIGVVVAYGSIITPEMLDTTADGFVNVHFSLLPRWRGAAPVERSILAGDERTGVTLMRIDEGLDTGDVIAEVATPIGPNETGGSLTARLSFLGAMLLDDALPDYMAGHRTPVPQIETGASHAARLEKHEAELGSALSADVALRTIRAFHPRPVAWIQTDGGRLRVHRARPTDLTVSQGTVDVVDGCVIGGFEGGCVEFVTVQPEGKGNREAAAWFRGAQKRPVTFA